MARRPPGKSRQKRARLPAGMGLRAVFFLAAFFHIASLGVPGLLPLGGGLAVALTCLGGIGYALGNEEGRGLILTAIEAVLVSFLVYFGGSGSPILLLPAVLAPLTALERGSSAGFLFVLLSCVGWLGPVVMDRHLAHLNLAGVLYRVLILCSAPFIAHSLPRDSGGSTREGVPEQNRALEKANQLARDQSEARIAREQELYNERRKLEGLMSVAHRMAVLRNPDELLATIVDCAKEQLQVDVAVVLLRVGPNLVVEWKDGLLDTSAARLNCPINQGLLGRLVVTGESFLYSQADGTEPLRPFFPLQGLEYLLPPLRPADQSFQARGEDLRNFLVVPFKNPVDPQPLGLLLVANRLVGDHFTAHDQGYLQILATDAAIAIRNLFFMAELERRHDEMIKVLAQAIEAKDPYTSGHVNRVCQYSVELARAMGLPPQFIKELNTAAMLHDVGKISTPDSILMKEGPLTDAEFEIMKQHVVHSARIIRDIRSVSPEIQKMVLGHHERWDGRGYPNGLKGDEIPLGAQIMAVADAYDAMVSDRPYRKGMPVEEAMRRLERGAGTQFNLKVLSYFMARLHFEPQENAELRHLVVEARQKVGANLRGTLADPRTGGGSVSAGPARRGPERLELE